MPNIDVATNAELIDELLGRETFEGIVLEIDLESPANQAPAVSPSISSAIALPRAVNLLQLVASQIESAPAAYPSYLHQ